MRSHRLRQTLATLIGLTCFVFVTHLVADCAQPTAGLSPNQASTIKVLAADNGGVVCQGCIGSAASTWNSACGGTTTKPAFTTDASQAADFTSIVRFMEGTNTGQFGDEGCSSDKCACAFVNFGNDGAITMATVRIWQMASGPSLQNCTANATDILTHEFAHLLGINDPPTGCSCTNIMGSVTGAIDQPVCDQVDDNFETNAETPPDDPDGGHVCRPFIV